MRVMDLFSGIGGFSLAIQRAGIEVGQIYASEVDKYAQWIYRRQFPESIQLGDITKIGNEHGKIDIITGGFPCQAFSIAGERKGFSDTRGTLFFEIERLAGIYKPKYMVLENVKGILSHDGGNTIRTILDRIRRLNYTVSMLLLNTKDFGIPQNRERCFFICTASGERRPEISHIREAKTENTFSANCIDANYWKGIDNHGQRTCVEGGTLRSYKGEPPFRRMAGGVSPTLKARAREDGDMQPVIMYDDLSRGMKENTSGNAPTLRAQCHGNLPTVSIQRGFSKQYSTKVEESGTLQASRIDKVPNVSDGKIIRRLTPIECERLQDYPDRWTEYGTIDNGQVVQISDTQRYKTLGNSITVKVVEEIFKTIYK